LGNGWNVENLVSYTGVAFLSPELAELRIFDLIDRGLDPQSAIDWMHGNGYSTQAAYYPAIGVIAFDWEYMAFINGQWALVLRSGA
jgi:hypothetical protein